MYCAQVLSATAVRCQVPALHEAHPFRDDTVLVHSVPLHVLIGSAAVPTCSATTAAAFSSTPTLHWFTYHADTAAPSAQQLQMSPSAEHADVRMSLSQPQAAAAAVAVGEGTVTFAVDSIAAVAKKRNRGDARTTSSNGSRAPVRGDIDRGDVDRSHSSSSSNGAATGLTELHISEPSMECTDNGGALSSTARSAPASWVFR